MAILVYVHLVSLLLFVTLCFFSHNVIKTCFAAGQDDGRNRAGFAVQLVRADSAEIESMTKTERLRRAIDRSRSRLAIFSAAKDITSPVRPGPGEFLMQIAIGTPPLTYEANMDTGSDLVWTQCNPCIDCYEQPGEIFDPSKSSTFRKVPCSASMCQALPSTTCDSDCEYQYMYGDGSFTAGVLAYETLTLATTDGDNTSIPCFAFGCGHDNEGTFRGASGLVGLGRGPLSLVSQLGSKAHNKFSYCLVSIYDPASATSPLLFGDAGDLCGPGVKSTPLVQNRAVPSLYYLKLEGVSVGGFLLDIPCGTFDIRDDGSGGVIIDSGTTITYLEAAGYDCLKGAVQETMTLQRVNVTDTGLDLCYALPSDGSVVRVPQIVFHFAGGADYVLPPDNAFVVYDESALLCLAMGQSEGVSVLGNTQQQNFHILYDLGMNMLSFVPATCDSL